MVLRPEQGPEGAHARPDTHARPEDTHARGLPQNACGARRRRRAPLAQSQARALPSTSGTSTPTIDTARWLGRPHLTLRAPLALACGSAGRRACQLWMMGLHACYYGTAASNPKRGVQALQGASFVGAHVVLAGYFWMVANNPGMEPQLLKDHMPLLPKWMCWPRRCERAYGSHSWQCRRQAMVYAWCRSVSAGAPQGHLRNACIGRPDLSVHVDAPCVVSFDRFGPTHASDLTRHSIETLTSASDAASRQHSVA